jgi:cell division protein FtsX
MKKLFEATSIVTIIFFLLSVGTFFLMNVKNKKQKTTFNKKMEKEIDKKEAAHRSKQQKLKKDIRFYEEVVVPLASDDHPLRPPSQEEKKNDGWFN